MTIKNLIFKLVKAFLMILEVLFFLIGGIRVFTLPQGEFKEVTPTPHTYKKGLKTLLIIYI